MEEVKKNFNHYKLHTQYSICEGAIKIEDLEKFCKIKKLNSIGIADTSNLCGVLQFSETVSKSKTQPIIGSQIKFRHKNLISGEEIGEKLLLEVDQICFIVQGFCTATLNFF